MERFARFDEPQTGLLLPESDLLLQVGNPICKQIGWDNNEDFYQAWDQAKTGYPWIDACMMQLHKEVRSGVVVAREAKCCRGHPPSNVWWLTYLASLGAPHCCLSLRLTLVVLQLS